MKPIHSLLLGTSFLFTFSSIFAMGTPPQKPRVPDTSSNAVMLKSDDLRAAPDVQANALARVDKGSRVRLLATQGGWRQVSSAGMVGWVRVLSISADANTGLEWSDLDAFGKTPQGKIVAVAGARGLDEKMLMAAVYNEAEIQLLHGYAMSRSEAEQFAQAASLQVRVLAYLDSPKQSQETGAVNETSLWKGN